MNLKVFINFLFEAELNPRDSAALFIRENKI